MRASVNLALLAVSILLLTATPAFAAQKPSAVARYWRDFKEFWLGAFENQSAVVMITIGVGIVATFIITRGKWRK